MGRRTGKEPDLETCSWEKRLTTSSISKRTFFFITFSRFCLKLDLSEYFRCLRKTVLRQHLRSREVWGGGRAVTRLAAECQTAMDTKRNLLCIRAINNLAELSDTLRGWDSDSVRISCLEKSEMKSRSLFVGEKPEIYGYSQTHTPLYYIHNDSCSF